MPAIGPGGTVQPKSAAVCQEMPDTICRGPYTPCKEGVALAARIIAPGLWTWQRLTTALIAWPARAVSSQGQTSHSGRT